MLFRPFKALFFSMLAALLLLSACQGSTAVPTPTPEPTQPAPPPAEVPATPTPTLEPTRTPVPPDLLKGQVVEFWHPWQGDLASRALNAVDDFNQHNEWGIAVKIRPLYNTSGMEDVLEEAWQQSSPDLPGVIAASSDLLGAWEQAGRIVPLDSYLKDAQYGFSADELSSFIPLYWQQDQAGGQQIGIPALRTAQVIYYNKTWASELGFTSPPLTRDQFQEQACAAAKDNNRSAYLDVRGTGGYLVDTNPVTALSWLSAFNAQAVYDSAGSSSLNLVYKFQSPEAQNSLTFLRKMLDDGCAWVGKNPTPGDYFTRRMALFYSGMLSDLPDQQRILTIAKSKDEWTVLPFPGEAGKPVLYASGYSYAVAKSNASGAAAENAHLAAWLFIRWMEKPANAARLAEALPSLPISQSVRTELESKKSQFPWNEVLKLADLPADSIHPVPGLASWRQVRRLLEDSMHQVYYQPADQVGQVFLQLDQMIQEVLKK